MGGDDRTRGRSENTPHGREDETRTGREPGDEPVELSERGGVKKQKTDPSEYSDRTRDRSLDEDEREE